MSCLSTGMELSHFQFLHVHPVPEKGTDFKGCSPWLPENLVTTWLSRITQENLVTTDNLMVGRQKGDQEWPGCLQGITLIRTPHDDDDNE